jgi:tetratricopeptide (TPR) repeat protein
MNKTLIKEIEKIFSNKKFDEVLDKLLPIVKSIKNNKQTDIPLWNIYYLIGQSYRYKEDFKNASLYLKKSVETFENFSNLKALGIVYQQMGEYNKAIKLHSKSLDIDDSQPLTWNSLAYTQKYVKQYDKAEKNYETGINVHFKNIVKSLNNSRNSVFYPHNEVASQPLFAQYALDAAIYLTVKKNYNSISVPNAAAAEAIIKDETRKSLYWSIHTTKDGEKTFVVMPNFFNTLLHKLLKDETYFLLLGNKAEVLELQGKEEAKKYLAEAKIFKSLFEKN